MKSPLFPSWQYIELLLLIIIIMIYRVIYRCIEQMSLPTVTAGVSYDETRQSVTEILRAEQKTCLHSIQRKVDKLISQLY